MGGAVSEVRLDTPQGCVAELTECNREVAEFAFKWADDAGELKTLQKRYDRLYKSAMRGTTGANADERAATASAAVEQIEEGLTERIENLIGSVETYRKKFDTIERRSSNAQSILKAHREGTKIEQYVPEEAMAMARRAA